MFPLLSVQQINPPPARIPCLLPPTSLSLHGSFPNPCAPTQRILERCVVFILVLPRLYPTPFIIVSAFLSSASQRARFLFHSVLCSLPPTTTPPPSRFYHPAAAIKFSRCNKNFSFFSARVSMPLCVCACGY